MLSLHKRTQQKETLKAYIQGYKNTNTTYQMMKLHFYHGSSINKQKTMWETWDGKQQVSELTEYENSIQRIFFFLVQELENNKRVIVEISSRGKTTTQH